MFGKALGSAFSIGIASRIVVQICALVQIMLAARFFGLTEFGAYALAWACTVIFKTFIFTGYYQAFLRSKTAQEDGATIFGVMCGIGAAYAGIAIAVSLLIGDSQPLTAQMFLALSLVPLIDALVAWNEVQLLRSGRMRTSTSIAGLGEVVATGAVWTGLSLGLGPAALVLGRYAVVIVQAVLSSIAVRRWPGLAMRRAVLARDWHTAFPLWVSTGTGLLTNYGADLILGAFLSPQAVGAYRGGARMSATAMDLVQQPLTMLSWARFSRLDAAGKRRLISHAWRVHMGFGAAVAWPVLMCVALMSHEIVAVVLDESWLPAAPIVTILCGVFAIRVFASQLEPTLTSFDRQYLQLRIRLLGLGLLIVGLFVFGRYGAREAALIQIVTALIIAVISLVAMRRTMQMPLARLAVTFVPGLGVAVLCGSLVVLSAPLRATVPQATGLALTVLGITLVWGGAVALLIARRALRVPVP